MTRKNEQKNEDKEAASKMLEFSIEASDFEEAISATGFGKFNYILLLTAFISSLSNSFATTTISYVVPVAECDLKLTLTDKGMLNGSAYLGTLCSIFVWGFLADTYGRRNLQIYGLLLDSLCNLGCACAQSFWMLFMFKYFGGVTGSGPYTILMSYISEFHGSYYRSKIVVFVGVFLVVGNAILPFIAWWILPMDLSINLYFINLNSWRLFLAICTLPSFFAAICYTFLPESPKFLMSKGRNEEALQIFQKIYKMNTGKTTESYPIRCLMKETPLGQHVNQQLLRVNVENKSNKNSFRNGLKQSKYIFRPPYLLNCIFVNILQFGCMLGSNTLRLWLPQFFTTIDEYQQEHNYTSDASLCEMISYNKNTSIELNTTLVEECIVKHVDDQVYINSIIVSICAVFGYLIVGMLIDKMRKKYLLAATFAITSISGIANYWSKSSLATLVFSSVFVALGGVCIQIVIAVSVELFPTTLRTMVISMTMIMGRLGAILGNVLFPTLLTIGCLPPFLLISGITLLSAVVSLFLPRKAPEFR